MPSSNCEWHSERIVFSVIHGLFFALAGTTSFLLQFDLEIPRDYLPHLIAGVGTWVAVRLAALHMVGLDNRRVRPNTISDIAQLVTVNAEASLIAATLIVLLGPPGFPRPIYFMEFALVVLGAYGIQLLRWLWKTKAKDASLQTSGGQQTIT